MKALLFKLIGLSIIVASIVVGWFWMDIKSFYDKPVNVAEAGFEFTIPSGTGLIRVANQLESDGVIDSARHFRWMAKFEDLSEKIRAGEYLIEPGTSSLALLQLFVSGKVRQHSLTIIEGWTFRQMLSAMHQHPKLVHSLKGKSDKAIMAAIGFPGEHPEGRFLPNTYHFPAGTTDVEFLKRAHDALQKVLEKAWAERDEALPLKNAYEALVLASIVEKETAVASERTEISGVFVRRLNKRMRLQTDPTVIYGMGDKYKGNIRRKDLKRDTPYNTYTRRGLPPTPIALPSEAAVFAAVHPLAGKTLYFVAKGDGSHYFSETIAEHNKAVRKYQLRRKKDYRSTPDADKS
jgi:UPF0755 protein